MVFKGSDLHSGFAPTEDPEAHKRWVEDNLSAAWNVAGPQNRVGYVSYIGGVPSDRLGSINITPPTLFGNYGSNQVHKSRQKTFAMHGHNILGGTRSYAERMGREIVANFWNSLQFCDLDINQDIDELMSKISFKDRETNSQVNLGPLPFNPQHNREMIERYLRLYAWHKREATLFHVNIPKARLLAHKNKKIQSAGSVMIQDASLWSHRRQPPGTQPIEATEASLLQPLDIEKVLGKVVKEGKLHYVVQIKGVLGSVEIEEDSERYVIFIFSNTYASDMKLRIKGSKILLDYLRSDMISRAPDHPALVLLSSNPQGSLTAEEDLAQATHNVEAVIDTSLTSTTTASASNETTQSTEGRIPRIIKPMPKPRNAMPTQKNSKRKTRDEPESYEVETIFDHRRDNQARN